MKMFSKIKNGFRKFPKGVLAAKDARIFTKATLRVTNNGSIEMGNVLLNDNTFLCSSGGKIFIEDKVSINRNSVIVCKDCIKIGEGTSIGPNVCIYDHDHKIDKSGFYKNEFKTAPIEIGKNVWIAANCTILKGTIIGDNSIIGAGCVVSGNIPKNTLVKSNRDLELIPLHE